MRSSCLEKHTRRIVHYLLYGHGIARGVSARKCEEGKGVGGLTVWRRVDRSDKQKKRAEGEGRRRRRGAFDGREIDCSSFRFSGS